MKNPNTAETANAEALNIDKETVAKDEHHSTQKATSHPDTNPLDLNYKSLLLEMDKTIQASPDAIIPDGDIHRFDVDKTCDQKGWYACHTTGVFAYAFYGDWSEGETYRWNSWGKTSVSEAEKRNIKAIMEASLKRLGEERREQQEEISSKCQELWNAISSASDDHSYLKSKGVKAHGIKVHPTDNGLIIPIYIDGKISSLQGINEDGCKSFRPGGKVSGGSFLIGIAGPVMLLCEGYATGASLHEATGLPTIVAFNANNLSKVAMRLKEAYPDTRFVSCADNDQFTTGNPGLSKAREAAEILSADVAYPRFKDPDIRKYGKLTDWNDYHQVYGLKAVESALKPKIKKAKRSGSLFTDLADLTKDLAPPDYLIDGLIERDAIGGFIGPSGACKSFMGVDIACAVAAGTKFAGKAAKLGSVLYLAGEGQNGITRRFAGWMQHNDIQIPPGRIQISSKIISLDTTGAEEILSALEKIGSGVDLVIVDTLARHMCGEENSNTAMGDFIKQLDKIRDEYGCTFIIMHHTGHSSDNSNRARGASAFYAALDFEFLLKPPKNGPRTFEGTKNKEGPLYPKRAFNLTPIELVGLQQDNGRPVNAAVIEWDAFVTELDGNGSDNSSSAAYGSLKGALSIHGNFNQIPLEDWREYAYQNSNCSSQDSKRAEFNRFKTKLLNDEAIKMSNEDKILQVLDQGLLDLGNNKDAEKPDTDG